jgi:hypothetical protein
VLGAATLTAFSAWLVRIVWLGGWHGLESQRLDILGKALFGLLFIVGIVLVSLGLAHRLCRHRTGRERGGRSRGRRVEQGPPRHSPAGL